MHHLQTRWKIEGKHLYYYGMRKKPNLLKNNIRVSKKEKLLLPQLPKSLNEKQIKELNRLINQHIVVEDSDLRMIPKRIEDAVFCSLCAANDFMIPGLELNDFGVCPMCSSKEETKDLKSVLTVLNIIPKSTHSRFDVALFYTGGKDSSYLLYYLSKVLKLNVLALTWEIPYMSNSARVSIENAKKNLKNVEFINRKMADEDLLKVYRRLYQLERNTCACPSLAYVLFYPEMVNENIPYFVLGNEPVQMLNLYFNHLAPKAAYLQKNHKLLTLFINIGRVTTFRKILRSGQFESLMTMKQLAYGDSIFKRMTGYQNDLVSHVSSALKKVPRLLSPLKKAIRKSNWSGNIPAFVHMDFNDIAGGNYQWDQVKDLIIKEVGWVAPAQTGKGLHTSCNIEKCKEYTQFMNFYEMRSKMIPFSAIEISLASGKGHLSREQAVIELKSHMGFSLEEVDECSIMKNYLSMLKKD